MVGPLGAALRGLGLVVVLTIGLARVAWTDETRRDLPPPRVIPVPAPLRGVRPHTPAPPPPPPPPPPPVPARPGPHRAGTGLPPPEVRVLRGPGGVPVPGPGGVPVPRPGGLAAASDLPSTDDPLELTRPTRPPPRPARSVDARPQDVVFEVDRTRGTFHRFPDGDGREVFVMVGNPRIVGFEHTRTDGKVAPPFSLKANRMVLWVDRARFEPLGAFENVRESFDAAKGDVDRTAAVQSLLQEAVLGIYAEGAVELRFGDLEFRAEQLHIEPQTYQALFVEPRFEGLARGQAQRGGDLPLHVRARRARLVAKGVAIFDDADLGASRADDRMELRVATLTVRELEEGTGTADGATAGTADPNLLGFRNLSAQTYAAGGVQFRGERLPLFYVPHAEFGYPGGESLPVRFKRFIYGNRSSLGRYVLLGVGGVVGPASDPLFDWTALVGGYTEKGPSAGVQIEWDKPRTSGLLNVWGVWDFEGKDFNDYHPPEDLRGFVNFQTKARLTDRLRLQSEVHDFSDRDVNLEYWENEELTHKDYESYVRLRYERDAFIASALGKWHMRYYETETGSLPELDAWVTSFPLLVPRRRGAPGVDVTSINRAGYYQRYSDTRDTTPEYEALRLQTDTRAHLAFDVQDVRISSYAGAFAASYTERTDGGEDLLRAALLAGARANLQLHRTYGARGGFLQLDRLRHVVDLDAGFEGQWFSQDDLADVPYFDQTDDARGRSATVLRVRNRAQTREKGGGQRDLVDLELSWWQYIDDRGPYGIDGPGEIDYVLRGEPRPNLFLAGEGRWDLGENNFYRASIGAGAQIHPRLALFSGFRYIRGEATAPFVDLSWRWSDKYGIRVLEQYDFRNEENRTRFVFGRYSADHAWFFGASVRGANDYGIEFRFSPTLGAAPTLEGLLMFNDQPTLDPWSLKP